MTNLIENNLIKEKKIVSINYCPLPEIFVCLFMIWFKYTLKNETIKLLEKLRWFDEKFDICQWSVPRVEAECTSRQN